MGNFIEFESIDGEKIAINPNEISALATREYEDNQTILYITSGACFVVNKDYETVKSLLAGEQKPMEKVTAEEIEKMLDTHCKNNPQNCAKMSCGECESNAIADYINGKAEGK